MTCLPPLIGFDDAGVTAADLAIPHTEPGMRIGLFGGSFNPPHDGHVLVAEIARRRLRLSKVWWIVTPGNPLKDHGELRPIGERLALVRDMIRPAAARATAFEAAHHIRFTADTLALLSRRRPGVRFVWIMGADSLATFHRWQDWRRIVHTMPIAVVDRPGSTLTATSAPMARAFAGAAIRERDAALLPDLAPPAWVFLHGRRSSVSSTFLRRRQG